VLAVWQCGSVAVLVVAVWQCGSVAVWQCSGRVAVCQGGNVAVWQCWQCGSVVTVLAVADCDFVAVAVWDREADWDFGAFIHNQLVCQNRNQR
jgi:hypothetical protein